MDACSLAQSSVSTYMEEPSECTQALLQTLRSLKVGVGAYTEMGAYADMAAY